MNILLSSRNDAYRTQAPVWRVPRVLPVIAAPPHAVIDRLWRRAGSPRGGDRRGSSHLPCAACRWTLAQSARCPARGTPPQEPHERSRRRRHFPAGDLEQFEREAAWLQKHRDRLS